MSIYRYLDYRDVIEEFVRERKKVNSKFTYAQLAEHMGVQKTYVSKVLKQQAHFNTDQIYIACEFLGLSAGETYYVHLLLEYQRSGLKVRKQKLLEEIKSIQERNRSTRENLKAEFIKPEANESYLRYYLEPVHLLVHSYLTIPGYQQKPKLICEKLQLSEDKLNFLIKHLTELGLVEWQADKGSYRVLNDHLHLDGKSFLNPPFQALFRLMAMEQNARLSSEKKFNFAVTLSANEETRQFIREEFMQFLKRIEPAVKAAEAREVYQMNFDLFNWSVD